jgi:ribosomal protein S18 acetylase RimI-like enzyme
LRVELLTHAELGAAAGVLARAFRDNPLNRGVVGGSERRRVRANRAGVAVYLPAALERARVTTVRQGGALAGVLVATPPYRWPIPGPSMGGFLRLLWGQGFRVARRWGEVARELARHHPQGPLWYLATLGVEPALWGRGAGQALLRDFVAQVDADGSGAYLETDRRELVGFYERAGFRVEQEIEVFGVKVQLMERWPQTRTLAEES